MRKFSTGRGATVLAFVLGLLIATAGTATAAKLITGKQIKDGSIAEKDLAKSVRSKLGKAGAPGPAGPRGPQGLQGPKGDRGQKGDPGVGASNVLTEFRGGTGIALNGTYQAVLSTSLDPGAYVARATLHAAGDAGATVQCQIGTDHGGGGRAFTASATIASAGASVMVPAEVADAWSDVTGTVDVRCNTTGGAASIDQAILTVTRVGSVEHYIP